ncbi:MAG: sigma 54-interacting transcriptional regulator [Desulfopila sp.]
MIDSNAILQRQLEQLEKHNDDLRLQNDQFRSVIHQVPIGVMITSGTDNAILLVNPEFEQMIGLSSAQLVGEHFARTFTQHGGQIFYPGQKQTRIENFSEHFISKKYLIAKDFELILQKPGGEKIFMRMSSSPVLGPDDNVLVIISVFNDVTQRKKEEELARDANEFLEKEVEKQTRKLRDANRKLETIFNASSESLWVCDGTGVVVSINRATEQLLGVKAMDIVGKNINDLVEEGLMDTSVTGVVLETGKQASIIQNTLKTRKQLLVTGSPVFDDDGNISMVIVNERDLTRLNQLKEELQLVKSETSRFKEAFEELHNKEMASKEIIAQSQEMNDILMICRKLAKLNISNILLLGESGTGKSLLAKYIHSCNSNLTGPFVKINCAALPDSLLEAELFGYERGAFTGASEQGKIGLFEMAENGTLFLDEIGELPIALQAKLLHCLEEKEIMHLGGLRSVKINCNVIAATNVDLVDQVQKKIFREDLYFRLNSFSITIPPLRQRPEDILELSLFFQERYNLKFNSNLRLSARELQDIQKYSFPGNVRELRNIIKKMIVLGDTGSIFSLREMPGSHIHADSEVVNLSPFKGQGLKHALVEFEKTLLLEALSIHRTTRTLADYLGVSQSQIARKLADYKLSHLLKHNKRRTTSR